MILIKRNSPEFKAISRIVEEQAALPSRKRVIRLYTLKPYHKLSERVPLNVPGIESAIVYDLAYEGLQQYLLARNKKLFYDEQEAMFYFKSNALVKWMELPFGFAGKAAKEVTPKYSLLKVVRKK